MKWPFRARLAGDEVVYEKKHWFFLLFPHRWHIGFVPYANMSSARNRSSARLNALMKNVEAELRKFADYQAELDAEKGALKNRVFDYNGIGEVYYDLKKSFKTMLPHSPEPVPEWRDKVDKRLQSRIFKEFKIFQDRHKNEKNYSLGNTVVYTTEEFANKPGFPNNSVQHVTWKDSAKSRQGKDTNKRHTIKSLRADNQREDGESQADWDKRLKEMADDLNNR